MANEKISIEVDYDGVKLSNGLKLTADDLRLLGVRLNETSQRVNKASDDVSAVTQHLDRMNATVVNTGKALAAAFVGGQAFALAQEMTMLNARYEELGIVMGVVGRNAGYNAQEMEQAALGMQKMGITMLESRNTTIQLAQAQINLADASKLARIAQDAAVVGATNSSEALKSMIYGIKSGQTDVLRTIGINVSFEQSYKLLADQLGVTTEALSEKQKMQARENAVLIEGEKLVGAYEASMGTAGKQMRSMARYAEDLKVMRGEVFNEALTVGVMAFVEQLKEANKASTELANNGALKEWGQDVATTLAWVGNTAAGVVGTFKLVGDAVAGMAARMSVNRQYSMKDLEDPAKLAQWRAAMGAIDDSQNTKTQGIVSSMNMFTDALDKRRGAVKADADAKIKTEQDYTARSLAVQKAYAGESLAVQQAAQLALAKGMFPESYPNAPKDATGGTPKKDKITATSQAQRLADEMTQDTAKLLYSAQHAADEISNSPAMRAYQRAMEELEAGKESIAAINKAKGTAKERAAALAARDGKKNALRADLNAGLDVEFDQFGKGLDSKALEDKNRATTESYLATQKGMQDLDAQNRLSAANAIKNEKDRAQALLAIEGERWTDLIGKYAEGDSQRQGIEERYQTWLVLRNNALTEQMKPGWQKLLEGWADTTKLMADTYNTTLEGMLKSGEDEFVRSKGDILSTASAMVNQLQNELLRLAYRQFMGGITQSMGSGFMGGLSGVLSGIFGGGGAAAMPATGASSVPFMTAHTGGIIGGDYLASKSVNPQVFAGAPRFHTGGIAGDEVPIIAKRGEGVFTPGQMAALGGGSGAGAQPVTVNVFPTAGQTATVTQKQDANGGMTIDVMLRQVEEAIADNVAAGSGAVSRAMESRYGLRTAVA